MTDREELPVWAKILLGIPANEDGHSPCAVRPSDSSAPAPKQSSERAALDVSRHLLRLDRVLRHEQLRRRILLLEAGQ